MFGLICESKYSAAMTYFRQKHRVRWMLGPPLSEDDDVKAAVDIYCRLVAERGESESKLSYIRALRVGKRFRSPFRHLRTDDTRGYYLRPLQPADGCQPCVALDRQGDGDATRTSEANAAVATGM